MNGVSPAAYNSGLDFQRPISLWRTAYSTITQSRANVPDVLAVTWIAQYAPHQSTFLPIYASAAHAPEGVNTGTQCKLMPCSCSDEGCGGERS